MITPRQFAEYYSDGGHGIPQILAQHAATQVGNAEDLPMVEAAFIGLAKEAILAKRPEGEAHIGKHEVEVFTVAFTTALRGILDEQAKFASTIDADRAAYYGTVPAASRRGRMPHAAIDTVHARK